MQKPNGQAGFTLLEILVVLIVIVVVISIAVPRFSSAESFARQEADRANRQVIEGAIELYKMDTGMVPEDIQDLIIPPEGVTGWRGPYLREEIQQPSRENEPYSLDEQGRIKP